MTQSIRCGSSRREHVTTEEAPDDAPTTALDPSVPWCVLMLTPSGHVEMVEVRASSAALALDTARDWGALSPGGDGPARRRWCTGSEGLVRPRRSLPFPGRVSTQSRHG